MSRFPVTDRLRASIANEAARIIHELGRPDYNSARNKAAQRLGCKDKNRLPTNAEIEQALSDYRQLFHADTQEEIVLQQRQLAVEAMRDLEQFSPRLVGTALSGNCDPNSPLQIHLFATCPEDIAFHLMNRGIPYRDGERKLLFAGNEKRYQPMFSFRSGETEIQLIWFPMGSIGHSPLSIIDQKPEKRASLKQVLALLEAHNSPV